jgi:hypothetical protein
MHDAVPLSPEALALARDLAAADGRSVPDTITAAQRAYDAARRQTPAGAAEADRFWAEVDAAYARLRADPAEWAAYHAEAEELAVLARDALAGEPPYPCDEDGEAAAEGAGPSRP